MKTSTKKKPTSIEEVQAATEPVRTSELLDWKPDGPTLRFDELLKVIRIGRSKAYTLMKSDPDFPEGVPLFDSDRSPRFWWTSEALAWSKKREAKFRQKKGRRQHA